MRYSSTNKSSNSLGPAESRWLLAVLQPPARLSANSRYKTQTIIFYGAAINLEANLPRELVQAASGPSVKHLFLVPAPQVAGRRIIPSAVLALCKV